MGQRHIYFTDQAFLALLAPPHQHRSQVLAWAAGEGMTRVTLLADRGNTEALDIYARLGFQPSAMSVLRKSLSG